MDGRNGLLVQGAPLALVVRRILSSHVRPSRNHHRKSPDDQATNPTSPGFASKNPVIIEL